MVYNKTNKNNFHAILKSEEIKAMTPGSEIESTKQTNFLAKLNSNKIKFSNIQEQENKVSAGSGTFCLT